MQNTVAKYILFFLFTVFITNAVTKMIVKKNTSEIAYLQSEDDNSDTDEKSVKDSDQKKFQYNPNTLTFDDDICHEFHFSNYYVLIKQVKYKASVPSLLDAIATDLYSPPKV